MGNNEGQTVQGKQEVHPDPSDRKPGTIHAKWGDKPQLDKDGYPIENSSGVRTENNEDRRGVLERVFDDVGAAATAEQAFVNQHFATPSGERHTPHSPLLQKAAAAFQRSTQTLKEQVRGIMNR